MKSKFVVAFFLSVTAIITLAISRNSDFSDYKEKEYDFRDFEGVRLGGTFRVEIRQAEDFSVTAQGKEEDLKNLQFEVVNGVLVASCNAESSNSHGTLLIISMPVLKSANLHGATSSIITGFNKRSENFALKISGSSRVVTDSHCNSLDIQIEDASVLVFKEQIQNPETSRKRSSRLLGRGGICEYSYHRVGWI